MTRKEVLNYLKEKSESLFKENNNLFFLAPYKIRSNKYIIHANIKIDSKDIVIKDKSSRTLESSNTKDRLIDLFEKNQIPYQISFGEPFKLLGSKHPVKANNIIRNKYSETKGSLGLIFKEINNNKYYFLSNQHVMGRSLIGGENDPIEKRIKPDEYIEIGKYTYGKITDHLDFAYGEFFSNVKINDKVNSTIHNNQINSNLEVNISSKKTSVFAYDAYVRIKDDDFFKNGKILKRQIIVKENFAYGNSGSVAIDINNNIIGLLFASSGKYSVLNDISLVFDEIKKYNSNLSLDKIKIIKPF